MTLPEQVEQHLRLAGFNYQHDVVAERYLFQAQALAIRAIRGQLRNKKLNATLSNIPSNKR